MLPVQQTNSSLHVIKVRSDRLHGPISYVQNYFHYEQNILILQLCIIYVFCDPFIIYPILL